MHEVDVLFLVEHVARELDVVTCLAAKLKRQFGLEVQVSSYYLDFERNLQTYNPKIVVVPFFYGADALEPRRYFSRWPRATFINLAWEQILLQVDIGVKTPRDEAARTGVYYLCWTPEHRDFLSSHGVPQERLLLTGNPTLQLYDRPYRKYFATRTELAERHGIDPRKKWVFFPESYQYAFMSDMQLQSLIDFQNADAGLLNEARLYSVRSVRRLFQWLSELRAPSDPIFILRPRPSTQSEHVIAVLRETIGRQPRNIAVIKSDSVREWVLAADHVISSHSTTLIEAAIAGKPVHLFSPEPMPKALDANWHHLVKVLDNKEAFLSALRQWPVEADGKELAAWARTLFEYPDALERASEAIADIFRGSDARPLSPSQVREPVSYKRRAYDIMNKLRRRSRMDAFGPREVARRIGRWEIVLGASSADALPPSRGPEPEPPASCR
jgi:surface carbohydrate biosynthesis protein